MNFHEACNEHHATSDQLTLYFLTSANCNTNLAAMQTCEAQTTLAPLNVES